MRPAAGGMLTHLELLLKGLGQAGYELTAACPVEELVLQRLRAAGVFRILPLDVGDALRPWFDPLVIGKFARFLQEHPFDILHAHGAKAGLITRLALNWRSRLAYPVIVSCHNEILPDSRHPRYRRARWLVEKYLARYTSHFIAVSPGIQDELIRVIGCPPHKVSFIPNGIELPESQNREGEAAVRSAYRALWGWPADSGSFVVGTACRLTWEKGVDVLLQAAGLAVGREPSLRFVIIGDGPMVDELQQAAASQGLGPFVSFLGYQEHARTMFPAFDAFALPSRSEGWPLSVMEAMAAGLPVVAARAGGPAYMIDSGRNGILVSPGDPQKLAEALILLARDREWAKELGRAAADYARRHFSAERMVSQVEMVYRRLLEGKQAVPVLGKGEGE